MGERKGTKALELWCKRLVKDIPNVQIENMTTSWRNGMAFCALVHHFRPDLIEMSELKPENIYDNNQLAFSIAEKHLGIPALLDPEDMVANDVPDRLSILTYLSQFYQRLGHTVSTKSGDNDSKMSSSLTASQPTALEKFGKSALDKCVSCDLPVYLAQRLIVSQRLYHRRCFRCSKCSGHLNPNNFKSFVGTEFVCDSCKNDKSMSRFLNNNDDQMGMLEFTDNLHQDSTDNTIAKPSSDAQRPRSHLILDKISIFEKSIENTSIDNKLESLTLKEDMKHKNHQDLNSLSSASTSQVTLKPSSPEAHEAFPIVPIPKHVHLDKIKNPDNVYKSDLMKNSFLKSQLLGETDANTGNEIEHQMDSYFGNADKEGAVDSIADLSQEFNVTDDTRLANSGNPSTTSLVTDLNKTDESTISIPPRRKKRPSTDKKINSDDEKTMNQTIQSSKMYPDDLNPFSDDEDEEGEPVSSKNVSTNPFSSSDDDEEEPSGPPAGIKNQSQAEQPVKRLIAANPFWSDGEEPTTDDDDHNDSSLTYQSPVTTSTPRRPAQSTPQRRKVKAPPPPPPAGLAPPPADRPSGSCEDVHSLCSVSSFNSTHNSDQKSLGKLTPMLKKRRPAPTPPDSISTMSGSSLHGGYGSMEKGVDMSGLSRRAKGPAPGLPLPERRSVKLQLSPAELQVQLDLLETQQLGLEKQGVLLEQMIRDKCEGDAATPAPQEEVEDLVIQLCELVNEKNDLFRKQTELMYIRRQQRLEQEQADIEHEIRVIQSRPAVNRIDADKAREEQLVSRLVEIVRLRDELVQQLDAERRRERQEDHAIAASIATKRAQRYSESNSSSLKSEVVTTPKKNKVKDKMKKQFKKAKQTLIPKKKDSSFEKKEEEKDKKSKTSPKTKTEA